MTLTRRGALGLLAGGAAVAALPRGARGEARPRYGSRAIGSLLSAPVGADPVTALSFAEVSLVGLAFDTLYRVDHAGQVVPHLAAAPPVADGAGAVRVPLRRGVRWHDGSELTAADVAMSLERARKAPLTAWALAAVSEARAAGDAVRLALGRAAPDLPLGLCAPGTAVSRGGGATSGTGPFLLDKLGGTRAELAAFDAHFAGRPYLDRLVLRWFDKPDEEARSYEVGDTDLSLRGAVAFAGHQPKHPTTQVDGSATVLGFVGFGRAHAALDADVAFRAMISHALNRAAFKHLGAGERVVPALSPESPDLGGPTPGAAAAGARDADARAALADAQRRFPDLGKASLTLQVIADATRHDDAEVARRLVAALDALGVRASYQAVAPAELVKRVAAGKTDLWIGQLVAPTTDPAHEIALAFAAGGDDWAARQLAAGPLDRAAAAQEFSRRWPVVPLYHRAVRAHHRRSLAGVAFDAQGRVGWPDAFVFPSPSGKGKGK